MIVYILHFNHIYYLSSEIYSRIYNIKYLCLFKKDKSILVQTYVYVLLSNLFFFGQTIDVSLIKL